MEPNFDMEAFIREKLENMKSLEDQRLLRDMMNEVFLPMYHQSEQNYQRLRERVRDEIQVCANDYAVYTSVMSEQELKVPHSFLRPMVPSDVVHHPADLTEARPILDTLCWECPYPERKRIQAGRPSFPGVLKTDQGEFEAVFGLKRSQKYLDKLYQLYHIFLANQIPWHTVCAPLLHHFYDLILLEVKNLPADASCLGFYSDFLEQHGIGSQERRIPVWNMEQLRVQSSDFPMPAIDKINYEYRIGLEKLEKGAYLAIPDRLVLAARREENAIIVVSPQDSQMVCGLYHVLPCASAPTDRVAAPVFSNRTKDQFAGRMALWYRQNVKTRGEFCRLLNGLGMDEHFHLRETKVLYQSVEEDTYNTDPFLKDEICSAAVSKTLVLMVESKREQRVYDYDLLSYYCSCIQSLYPEYRVCGRLFALGAWKANEQSEGVAL